MTDDHEAAVPRQIQSRSGGDPGRSGAGLQLWGALCDRPSDVEACSAEPPTAPDRSLSVNHTPLNSHLTRWKWRECSKIAVGYSDGFLHFLYFAFCECFMTSCFISYILSNGSYRDIVCAIMDSHILVLYTQPFAVMGSFGVTVKLVFVVTGVTLNLSFTHLWCSVYSAHNVWLLELDRFGSVQEKGGNRAVVHYVLLWLRLFIQY